MSLACATCEAEREPRECLCPTCREERVEFADCQCVPTRWLNGKLVVAVPRCPACVRAKCTGTRARCGRAALARGE